MTQQLTQTMITNIPFAEFYANMEREVELGNVVRKINGDLVLYTYSRECQYNRNWNEYTMVARGLIVCPDTEKFVATCFPKFFNYGEMTYALPDCGFEVLEKMDGSMGLVYFHNNRWNVATKGSFNSDQAIRAEEYLQENINYESMNTNYTYLVEIIYPENRIVIPYENSRLVLIGVYDNTTGYDLGDSTTLKYFADEFGFDSPKVYSYDSVHDILLAAKELPVTEEGYVLRFANGYRVKIKGDQYLAAHKIVTNMTPKRVWEMVKDQEDIDSIRKSIPEEFLTEFNDLVTKYEMEFLFRCGKIRGFADTFKDMSNKQIGLKIQALRAKTTNVDPWMLDFVFPTLKKNFLNKVLTGGRERDRIFETFKPTDEKEV